ncbi:MASE3 domain-containing protein [Geobacter sulfurreducens]|uniref:MASE3 domain-containing protein n=1 Tax=Geobacter sulfurreducens TaxID=35554 RepID=UPI000DBB0982|nr:MASE3 domain-containing protein [Geobacter sulfurreducens]BBA69017.1 Phytochrome-like protein cph1 [Geobacter sulfurreducens]
MTSPDLVSRSARFALVMLLLAALVLTSRVNYLLFHTLTEIVTVVAGCGIFMVAWHARRQIDNHSILLIGISHLFVAIITLFHALSYRGMGVFPGAGTNLSTQLWIGSRLLQGASLALAPLFVRKRLNPAVTVTAYMAVTSLFLLSILCGDIFPLCFSDEVGLTPFKKGAEFLAGIFILAALTGLLTKRRHFDARVFRRLSLSLVFLATSGFVFALNTGISSLTGMTGHLLTLGGFILIYRAMVETGLERPYDLLFRDLKESEERYRSLYNRTPVMLHSIDRDGKIVNVSDFWLETLGYRRDEVLGRLSADFMTDESRAYVIGTVVPEFLRTGRTRDIPLHLLTSSGKVIDVLLSSEAERDEEGEIVRSLSVMTDVTEQRRAARQIERLNESLASRAMDLEVANGDLEAFNYSVSHDLRSHLTVIRGFSDVLLEICTDKLDDECRSYVRHIGEETGRMNGLIGTLLDFSRVARVELERVPVNLSTLAEEIALELRMKDQERMAEFIIIDDADVTADPGLMRVVMENLLGNAWKYTGRREQAVIEFGKEEMEGQTVFFVRDNGAGFSSQQADKLFLPFQRLHGRSEFPGHGIGLATVHRIISRHGGTIWAQGEEGAGAVFYFTL